MARDYKHRANPKKKKSNASSVVWWKWLLSIGLIIAFVIFLDFLGNNTPSTPTPNKNQPPPKKPRFTFYTLLPETEVTVPDDEINTRHREEQFGKKQSTQYVIQAGAFKAYSEADKRKASLAFLGIESNVEKINDGNIVWHRVIIGPLARSRHVSRLKAQLKQKGIDVVVTEIKK